jgi:hypothetical protein
MAESEDKSAEQPENGAATGATGATSPEPRTAAKSEKKPDTKVGGKRRAEPEKKRGREEPEEKKHDASATVTKVRSIAATVVWIIAVLAAAILAVGALMVTLDFNRDNAFVDFFITTANNIDFGVFKDFEPGKGETQADVQTKKVLVNWGIAALIYLVGGKLLERVIRP